VYHSCRLDEPRASSTICERGVSILCGRHHFCLVLTTVYLLLVSVPLPVLVAQWPQVEHFPFVPLVL